MAAAIAAVMHHHTTDFETISLAELETTTGGFDFGSLLGNLGNIGGMIGGMAGGQQGQQKGQQIGVSGQTGMAGGNPA